MARKLLFFLMLLLTGVAVSAQTSLAGKVTDDANGEPLISATVQLKKGDALIKGAITDWDGNYSLSNIDPGTYDVEISYLGYATQRITDVKVIVGKANELDVKLSEGGGVDLTEVVVKAYKNPLIEKDKTTQGVVITSDEIKNLPTRNVNALAAQSAGAATTDEGDDVSIRGSRTASTNYYIDGIRVQGDMIPESEIDQLQVITGGVEAKYGDVTGGIISITTKGPADKLSGGIEAETSSFLDPYNNNLVGVNVSGPILKKKGEKGETTLLGFRLAGRYTYNQDDDPNAVPVYQVKDDKLKELQDNPVILKGEDPLVAADFLRNADVNELDAQPYEDQTMYSIVGKLDARLSESIDVTLSGSYIDDNDRFTPNGGSQTRANWRLLNAQNNPYDHWTTKRGNFRFRHNIGGGELGEDKESASVIRNVSYTLQAGYERRDREITDSRHEFNYFDYGHVGTLNSEWVPTFELTVDSNGFTVPVHTDFREVLRGYTPSEGNWVLANYNNILDINTGEGLNADIGDQIIGGGVQNQIGRTDFIAFNGTVSSVFADSWGFHTNVGTVYNLARKFSQDVYTFNANASFEIVPNSSDDGKHNIELGLVYEQRTNRLFDVEPNGLWTLARQVANSHIQGLPEDLSTATPIGSFTYKAPMQPDMEIPIYAPTISENADALFYKTIRQELGLGLTDYVNTDGLDPSILSLDMFAAKELNDQDLLNYYGYDHTGQVFDGTFNDFFTAEDENSIRTFPVAPNRPIYSAVYLQDKFKYRDDVIFRFGVRVDRYDANTKVLKDKYSLYEIMGADDFHATAGGVQPSNIGGDYKVYLNESGGVKAYRDEDQWYAASGQPVNNPADLFTGGLVTPKYKDSRVDEDPNFIKSRDFDPNVSFEDYQAQINVMPRIAFSFPISDAANFFAHYDVLVERPASNTIATALDYFYFVDENSTIKNNPNLKPATTVDYEVGFQQRVTNSSAIKMSAYYKEMRDMIQFRTIFPVPLVGSYDTYDNVDFGTVKGFSFQYDLRRTGNISLLANYTIQFAEGTGSDANSARSISSRGVLRTLTPLSFDERHRINLSMDYRYQSGEKYNGPEIAGKQIFANTGLNLQAVAVSGRPYTKNVTPLELDGSQISGSLNGARKPWNYTLNLRVDKTISLGSRSNLNIYFRISNLLDTRNIVDVYPATGAPDDDGFLASSRGADQLESIQNSKREVEAYLNSYQWRLLNPNYYTLPRRMFLGATLNF